MWDFNIEIWCVLKVFRFERWCVLWDCLGFFFIENMFALFSVVLEDG